MSENPSHFKPGHEIGISGRWKPGQSGNPKGRPLSKPFKASLDRILNMLEPGNPELALDKLNGALYAKAMNGDVAAYKELADRYEGKVPNPIGGTDELPPITAFSWKPIEHVIAEVEPPENNVYVGKPGPDTNSPGDLDGSNGVDSSVEPDPDRKHDAKRNGDLEPL